jgi:hypothetical protein
VNRMVDIECIGEDDGKVLLSVALSDVAIRVAIPDRYMAEPGEPERLYPVIAAMVGEAVTQLVERELESERQRD